MNLFSGSYSFKYFTIFQIFHKTFQSENIWKYRPFKTKKGKINRRLITDQEQITSAYKDNDPVPELVSIEFGNNNI